MQPLYRHVMIVMASGGASAAALAEGLSLAQAHGAEVIFFIVRPQLAGALAGPASLDMYSDDMATRAAEAECDRLHAAADAAARAAGVPSRGIIGTGFENAEHIVSAAQNAQCDIIVVASEGRNALMRLVTGSLVPGLITAADIPVLVCKHGGNGDAAEASA